MKVTNYGLGGLVEEHNDPYGYNEGAPVPPERADLVHSGDIIATVMGKHDGKTLYNARTIANMQRRGLGTFFCLRQELKEY